MLIDLNLPGEGGVAVYRRLAHPPGPLAGVPAALFTQGAAPTLLAEAVDAGIEFLVGKELVGRPDEWKARLDEVLRLAGQPAFPAVPDGQPSVRGVAERLGRALRLPAVSRLGEEVVAAMVRRALRHAVADGTLSDSAVDRAMSSATLEVNLAAVVASRPNLVTHLLHLLGRQVECLLGREDSALFRAALAAAPEANGRATS